MRASQRALGRRSGAAGCATLPSRRVPACSSRSMPAKIVHVNTARGYRGGERQTELLIRGLASRNVAASARHAPRRAARRAPARRRHRRSRGRRRAAVGGARDARCVVDPRARRPQRLRGVPALAVVGHAVRHHAPRQQSDSRSLVRAPSLSAARRAWPPSRRRWRRSCAPTMPRLRVVRRAQRRAAVCPSTRRKSAAIRARFAGKLRRRPRRRARQRPERVRSSSSPWRASSSARIPTCTSCWSAAAMTRRCCEAAAAGLSNLTFTGFVDNVGDYLAAFDVFILPSNREGIGSILLDAMEQGLPVVASRVGGVPDIVHRRRERLADRSREPRAAARRDPHAASRSRTCAATFGQRGQEFAKDFTGEAMCRKYLALYESRARPARLARGLRGEHGDAIKALCITEDPDRPTTAMFVGLKNAGVDVTVICPAGERRDVARAERRARARPAAAQAVRPRSRAAAPRRARRRARYDILHLFSNKALQNGLAASRGLPVKIVAYRGIVGNVSFFSPVSWLRFLNPRIDRIVCVADAVRDYFLQMRPAFLRLPPERLVTIYKGHSLDWYRAAPADLTAARRAGGLVRDRVRGELSAAQGHRGARRCVRPVAGGAAHLLLDRRRNGCAAARRGGSPRAPRPTRIHVLGHRSDAPALTAACDVFVLPSTKREGLARSLIEAMAYGVAPVVTDCGGSPELVVARRQRAASCPSPTRLRSRAPSRPSTTTRRCARGSVPRRASASAAISASRTRSRRRSPCTGASSPSAQEYQQGGKSNGALRTFGRSSGCGNVVRKPVARSRSLRSSVNSAIRGISSPALLTLPQQLFG